MHPTRLLPVRKDRPMSSVRLMFEFVPVILAIVAIQSLLTSVYYGRRAVMVVPPVFACILLIVAQSGWTQAMLSSNTLALTVFDTMWTLYNTLVMVIFIHGSKFGGSK